MRRAEAEMTAAASTFLAAFATGRAEISTKTKSQVTTKMKTKLAQKPKGPKKNSKQQNRANKARFGAGRQYEYTGPNATKDRIIGDAGKLYFEIRETCNKSNDDVAALRKLLPARVCEGQDFSVWPRQHLLLHGLVKQGCVECVRYLLCDLKFNINQPRQKDGCVPLHICFYNLQGRNLDLMADLLVQLGANQNVANKWGEPPCMFEYKAASLEAGTFENIEKNQPELSSRETLGCDKQCVDHSPNCIADLHLDTRFEASFDLGPPASPTPKSERAGKIFTREEATHRSRTSHLKENVIDDDGDGWEVTSTVSLKCPTPTSKEIEAQAAKVLAETVWMAASSYSVYNIAGQIQCWKKTGTASTCNAALSSRQSGELFHAVRQAALAP